MPSEADRRAAATAATKALAGLGVTAVTVGEAIAGGSSRSVTFRAVAERPAAPPIAIVSKQTIGALEGFRRERAALSLIGEHRLPSAVRLLGAWRIRRYSFSWISETARRLLTGRSAMTLTWPSGR